MKDVRIINDAHRLMVEELQKVRPQKSTNQGVMICCPFHQDSTPSLSVNLTPGKKPPGLFFCLAGETQVITRSGTRRIAELAGTETEIINGEGEWQRVPFASYGVQRLYRIELTRNQTSKVVYATKEHRWLVRSSAEKTTTTLRKGDYLQTVHAPIQPVTKLDRRAVTWGFVLGDGTKCYGGLTRALMYGVKAEFMAPYFKDLGKATYDYKNVNGHTDDALEGHVRIVTGLDAGFKEIPSGRVCYSPGFIHGFLSGLIAADGCVDKLGTVSLHSADRKVLERVRTLANSVGIVTLSVTTQLRKGYGKVETPIYRIHFAKSTFSPELLLNPEHRRRFETSSSSNTRFGWKVLSVTKSSRVEEVFCAEVKGSHAFALKDNILTGNCFGCGAKGLWNKLARKMNLRTVDERAVHQMTEFHGRNVDPKLLTVENTEVRVFREWDLDFVEPWPRDRKWRGFPGKYLNAIDARLAVDTKHRSEVIVLPVYVGQENVGWVRGLLHKTKGQLSYVSSKGEWVKTQGLLGYDLAAKLIAEGTDVLFVVEGPRDALRLLYYGIPAVAVLGAQIWSSTKRDLLLALNTSRIVAWLDSDKAGIRATNMMRESFAGRTEFRFVNAMKLLDRAQKDYGHEQSKVDPANTPVELFKLTARKYGARPVAGGWKLP